MIKNNIKIICEKVEEQVREYSIYGFLTLKIPLQIRLKKNFSIKILDKFLLKINEKSNVLKYICITENSYYVGYHAHILIFVNDEKIIEELILFWENVMKIKKINYIFNELFYYEKIHNNDFYNVVRYMTKVWGLIIESKYFSNFNEEIKILFYDKNYQQLVLFREKIKKKDWEIIILLYQGFIKGLIEPVNFKDWFYIMLGGNDIVNVKKYMMQGNMLILSLKSYIKQLNKEIFLSRKKYENLLEAIYMEIYKSNVLFSVQNIVTVNLFDNVVKNLIKDIEKSKNIVVKNFIDVLKKAAFLNILKVEKFYNMKFDYIYFMNSIIYGILRWCFNQCESKEIVYYEKIKIVLNLKQILNFILYCLNLTEIITDELVFILFEFVLVGLVKYEKITILYQEKIKVDEKIKSKFYFRHESQSKQSQYNILNEKKDPNLDLKRSLLFGIFFLPPKNWELVENENFEKNFSGVYIFNKVFKFLSFMHKKEQNMSSLNFDFNLVEQINNDMKIKYKIDNLFLDCFLEKLFFSVKNKEWRKIFIDEVDKDIEKRLLFKNFKKVIGNKFSKLEEKNMFNKWLVDYKNYSRYKVIQYIGEEVFYYGEYIEVRGRFFSTSWFNLQSDKFFRTIVVFNDLKKIDCDIDHNYIHNYVINELQKGGHKKLIDKILLSVQNSYGKFNNYKEFVKLYTEDIFEKCYNLLDDNEKFFKYILILTRSLYQIWKNNGVIKKDEKLYVPYMTSIDAHAQGTMLFYFIFNNNKIFNYLKKDFDNYIFMWIEYIKYIELKKIKLDVLKNYSLNIWRKVIKRTIMTMIYSATEFSLRKYLYEGLEENNVNLLNEEIKLFVTTFIDFIKQQDVMVFMKIFSQIVKKIWYLPISLDEKKQIFQLNVGINLKFFSGYYQSDVKKYHVRVYTKLKKMSILNINKMNYDIIKNARAMLVNTIHVLDAYVCYIMKQQLTKSMLLYTNHDCFYVTYNKKDLVVILYNNIFEAFINLNISFSSLYKNLFQAIEKNVIQENKWKLTESEIKVFLNFYENYSKIDIKKNKNIFIKHDGFYTIENSLLKQD